MANSQDSIQNQPVKASVRQGGGEVLINARQIEKEFTVGQQQIKVLKGISLSINEGDFVIIFGPSGCGKSTLLHTILGLESPTKGEITFAGKNMYTMNEDERTEFRKNHIGMVYQQSIWIRSLNVFHNVAFPLHLYGLTDDEIGQKVVEVMRLVGMEEWKDHWPTELSGGQQQRVSVARALIKNPTMIIADEPTGNLDSVSARDLMELLGGLNKKGKTIIMVTHDLAYLPYANRIFHIMDGMLDREYNEKDKNDLVKKLSLDIEHGGINKKDFQVSGVEEAAVKAGPPKKAT